MTVSLSLLKYNVASIFGLTSSINIPSDIGICFIPTNNNTPSSLAALKDLWQQGILFFCDTPLPVPGSANASTQIDRLETVLNGYASTLYTQLTGKNTGESTITALDATGFVWLSEVENLLNGTTTTIKINNLISFQSNGSNAKITRLQKMSFGNYYLGIAPGTIVSYENEINTFRFENQSILAPSLYFFNEENKKMGKVGWSAISKYYTLEHTRVNFLLLPEYFGTWVFPMTMEKDTSKNLENDVQLFQAGFKYYYMDQNDQSKNINLFYPFFDVSETSITLFARLDSLNIADPNRTYLEFINEDEGYIPFCSTFRTLYGLPLLLIPDSSSKLVFCTKPSSGDAMYYLAPSGSYTINDSNFGSGNQLDIICGTSGLESFSIRNNAESQSTHPLGGNQFIFQPGCAAVVESLKGIDPELINTWTTSWVALIPNQQNVANLEIMYNVQPRYQHYYNVMGANDPWDALSIPVGKLPSTSPPNTGAFFPMVPYSGVTERTNKPQLMGPDGLDASFFENFIQYESNVLAPARKKLIESNFPIGIGTELSSHIACYGTIPSGLCVGFNSDLTEWIKLVFANGPDNSQLAFDQITGGFKKALQSNEVFMVLSDQVTQVPGFTTPESMKLDLGGWTFEFASGKWQQHNTLCIIKFHHDNLWNLAQDLSRWQWQEATVGNGSTNETQSQLITILNDVNSKSKTDPNYNHFWEHVVNNKSWQGILFFNCSMSLNSIPSEFALLSNGIDAADFYAHHVGFSLTPVIGTTQSAGSIDLQMHTTSSFGLVDYQDDTDLNALANYGFKVKSFEVRFVNGTSVNFKGSVQLQINQLFGHQSALINPTTNQPSPVPYMTLSGSAQRSDDHMSVSFENDDDYVFQIQNSVVEQLTIDRVRFFALNQPPTTQPPSGETVLVKTRFQLEGNMKFVNLKTAAKNASGGGFVAEYYDLFSLDLIGYDKLHLDMNFIFDQPRSTLFELNQGQITLNTSGMQVRSASLASQLPLRLSGFKSSFAGQTIKQMSYMPVNIESFNADTSLQSIWYGLLFNLNLGTLGALSDNKPFLLELIVAWGPNGNTDKIWLGLKVPGMSAGGTFYNLENVVKLGVQDILLSEYGTNQLPMITFQSIGLSILGQTVPPGGTTDLAIFGGENDKSKLLAWLAAYVKNTTVNS